MLTKKKRQKIKLQFTKNFCKFSNILLKKEQKVLSN